MYILLFEDQESVAAMLTDSNSAEIIACTPLLMQDDLAFGMVLCSFCTYMRADNTCCGELQSLYIYHKMVLTEC